MGHSGLIDRTGRVKDDTRRRGLGIGLTIHRHRHFLKHAIYHTDVEVHMPVQTGAEAVDVDLGFCQGDCANLQRRLVHTCRTGAMVLQAGNDVVRQMRRCLHSGKVLHEGQTPRPLQEYPRQAGDLFRCRNVGVGQGG